MPLVYDNDKVKSYYASKGVTPDSFKLSVVDEELIFKMLKSVNPQKSTGLDLVASKFIKVGAGSINVSIHTSTCPDDFKQA